MISPLLEAVFPQWSPRKEEGKEGGRQEQAATPAAQPCPPCLTAAYFEDDESKSRSE